MKTVKRPLVKTCQDVKENVKRQVDDSTKTVVKTMVGRMPRTGKQQIDAGN